MLIVETILKPDRFGGIGLFSATAFHDAHCASWLENLPPEGCFEGGLQRIRRHWRDPGQSPEPPHATDIAKLL
ncbi:hypothetical protein ACVIGB_008256 [Bradyrhizobium sp. USDA 4341]